MTTTSPKASVAPFPPGRRSPGTGSARSRRPQAVTFGHWWWALPGVLLVVAVHYVSTAIGASFGFTDWTGIGSFEWIGFENFARILQDPTKVAALVNTLFLAFASVVLVNVGGVILALGVNRLVRTRHALRVLFFMPAVLSPLAVSYIWKFVFDYEGPLNAALTTVGLDSWTRAWLADPVFSIWAVLVVLVWQQVGFAMVIYLAGLASVSPDIEEAAAIDGAGLWRRFWSVILPALRPAIAISTTLGLVNGLRTFDQIMALTGGGPAGATETLATQVYKQAFALGNFGYGAALALLLTLIIVIFTIIQNRLTGARRDEG